MINWLFIPTWSLIAMLLVGMGWLVWNFDREMDEMRDENAKLRNRLTRLEGERHD